MNTEHPERAFVNSILRDCLIGLRDMVMREAEQLRDTPAMKAANAVIKSTARQIVIEPGDQTEGEKQ